MPDWYKMTRVAIISAFIGYIIGIFIYKISIEKNNFIFNKKYYGIQTNLPYGNINIYRKL